jgi:hypothetical protein
MMLRSALVAANLTAFTTRSFFNRTHRTLCTALLFVFGPAPTTSVQRPSVISVDAQNRITSILQARLTGFPTV